MTTWTLVGRENGEKRRWTLDVWDAWGPIQVLAYAYQQLPQARPLLLVIPGGKP